MDKKEIAKRYLVCASIMLTACFLITFLLLTAFSHSGIVNAELNIGKTALISLCCALVPTGAYTGILHFGLKIREFGKKQAVLFAFFSPIILAFVTVSGIILIIPEYIISFKNLRG